MKTIYIISVYYTHVITCGEIVVNMLNDESNVYSYFRMISGFFSSAGYNIWKDFSVIGWNPTQVNFR